MWDAFLYTYLFVVNVVAYLLYAADKHRAYYGLWRYPETLLLGIAIAGGAYGAGMGMWLFRHKTLHRAFLITVPLCLLIWLIVLILLCMK